MAGVHEDRDRQVVPLWRNFGDTIRRSELSSFGSAGGEQFTDEMVSDALDDWRLKPDLSNAADLVSAALTLGRFDVARDAAERVVSDGRTPAPARSAALLYLARGLRQKQSASGDGVEPTPVTSSIPTIVEELRSGVRELRHRLIEYPRDPILWCNLGRQYASLGLDAKAVRAIQAALAMAPNNRYILRAASRFYLHQGDYDRAHWVLANAESLRFDPWVLAAEIATAAAGRRQSQNLKLGRRMIESQRLSPFHLSELASAVGTIESLSGNLKFGRKLIGFSLQQPAENSIAQAAWLSRKLAGPYIPQTDSTASFEANAFNSWNRGLWVAARAEARRWLSEQPFSSRPAILGGYLALAILEDLDESIAFAEHGLRSNPADFTLQNNLAVSFALQGNVEAAARLLKTIDRNSLTSVDEVTFLATTGLLAFRSGQIDIGRRCYNAAIEKGHRLHDIRAPLARIYFAMEELRIRSTNGERRRSEAIDAATRLAEPWQRVLVQRLERFQP